MGTRRRERAPLDVRGLAIEVGRVVAARHPQGRLGVVSLSLGSMVALSLAREIPELIDRVVVINGSSTLSPVRRRLRPAGLLQLLTILATRDTLSRERRVYALTTRADAATRDAWARRAADLFDARPIGRGVVLGQLVAAARFVPPVVRVPSLVLSSRGDRVVSPSCSWALARHLGAPHENHPDAGHDLPLDDPGWVIERMRQWLPATQRSSNQRCSASRNSAAR